MTLGGQLTEPSGGANRINLFSIDRSTAALSAWAPNPDHAVNALHLHKGVLYTGGAFTQIAANTRSYLAAFDTATLTLSTWNPGPASTVNAITSNNNIIWVGGNFFSIAATGCNLFAGIDEVSGLVSRIPAFSFSGGGVNTLYKVGCYMIAGGNFQISNTSCNALAIYNMYDRSIIPTTTLCVNVGELTGNIKALASIGRDLYFGGTFIKVNGRANATNVERIRFPLSYIAGCLPHISARSGNWNSPSTWQQGIVPPIDAQVIINHLITVTSNASCYSVEVGPGGNVQVVNGVHLTVVN